MSEMSRLYQSEIRDNTIRDLLIKVKQLKYGLYLKRIKLTKVRAFSDETVDFDFPVTALIGTNGGGKSTILGAAAMAHKSMKPGLFFPKSFIGDETMSEWSIGYEIVDKSKNPNQLVQRSARFKRSKWVRDDLIDRPVLYFGIQRTVPAGERREFKKLANVNYKFSGERKELSKSIQDQVAKVLGKDVSKFEHAAISPSQAFYVGGNGAVTYSEFHFGAGESSIIRMISEIESAPENSIILIEEIENGLHPVAVRRMVEYLIDVAERKAIQSIFTTHSEDALLPLPSEAIWSSIDGKVRQGRISIEALRAITGRVEKTLAIFVEDNFAKDWIDSIIRNTIPDHVDEIGVYAVSGDGQAYSIHQSHQKNPAISHRMKSVCVLDGDSQKNADEANGIIKLPGTVPESEVFNYVASNISELSMRLAVALHLQPEAEGRVKAAVEDVSRTNRDPHLLFSQVGQRAGLIPAAIVSSAFIGLWLAGNRTEVTKISEFIEGKMKEELPRSAA
jgi:predicted ATPase